MTTIYGPKDWDAREAAECGLQDLQKQAVIEHGNKHWNRLGEQPHADAFWNVVAPLVHALATDGAGEAGFGEDFSAATACEQLMHEIALAYGIKETT